VGKIVEVFPSASQVLLINDKDGAVGALFLDSRTQGIVKGTGDSEPRMDYVSNDEKVQAGEEIVTSGLDRIFPKGLPVGTVESAAPGNPFQVIKVKPAVRLDRLEDVLILQSTQEINIKREQPATAESAAPAATQTANAASGAAAAKTQGAKTQGAKTGDGQAAHATQSAPPASRGESPGAASPKPAEPKPAEENPPAQDESH